jgi:hypothetical protein
MYHPRAVGSRQMSAFTLSILDASHWQFAPDVERYFQVKCLGYCKLPAAKG